MQPLTIGRASVLASLWGFAEATVFFIVPDVLLSWLALRSYKRAFVACLSALLGAVLGGAAIWLWAQNHADAARALFEFLPAISGATIESVQKQLTDTGLVALFLGPLTGTPYKIYAAEAADLGFGLAIFLAVSIPARLIRFVLVTILAGAASRLLQRRYSLHTVQFVHVGCWIVFYICFFWVMSDH
jgi:hypothetical protein